MVFLGSLANFDLQWGGGGGGRGGRGGGGEDGGGAGLLCCWAQRNHLPELRGNA